MTIASSALLGIVLLLAQHTSAAAQQPRTAPTSLEQATSAFKAGSVAYAKGDLSTARHAFERAVHLAPGVSAAHAALGSVLLSSGDTLGAIRELQLALHLSPQDPAALLGLALAFSLNHQDTSAADTLHRLQALDPALGTATGRDTALPLATSLAATGDLPGAEALLEHAVAAAYTDAVLADALGTVQARQKHFAQADETLRRAISLDSSLAPAHFHLGSVLLEIGQPAQATPPLEQAHTLQPAVAAYTIQLARALVETRREADAITLLQTSLRSTSSAASSDSVDLRYRLALTYQAAEDPRHALPLFAEVLTARPDDPEVLTNAGLARVQTGDAVGGIPLYLRALERSPKDPTLHEDLGVAYLQQSNLDQALVQFRDGLAIEPDNPQLHYDLALALKLKDDLAAAIPEFNRAATLDPSLPDPPYTLGIIYMQQSRLPEAAASFERALTLRPGNGDAWATLGSVYRQMNDPDKAIPALQHAIALSPSQPSPHITLAAIFASQGKKDEAASERKIAAALTRVAVNRQKADFGLDSGSVLLKRGQLAEAIVQFESAVTADPTYAPAHTALATALDQAGRKADAAEERRKALTLTSPAATTP